MSTWDFTKDVMSVKLDLLETSLPKDLMRCETSKARHASLQYKINKKQQAGPKKDKKKTLE